MFPSLLLYRLSIVRAALRRWTRCAEPDNGATRSRSMIIRERIQCVRSFAGKLAFGAAYVAQPIAPSHAQSQILQGPAAPGFAFSDFKAALDPVASVLAYIPYGLYSVWEYFMSHPPASVFLSATVAGVIAIQSIRINREIARLRETFSTMNADNWDKDVIDARIRLKRIKKEMAQSGQSLAKYCDVDGDNEEDIAKEVALQTILNDYENLALGIKHKIVDEHFVYEWMRTTTYRDWNDLSPLVNAYRSKGAENAYVEFEGLVSSWKDGKSFHTGRKLKVKRPRR